MTDEDEDSDLLHLYRAQARALPSAALDVRILAASRAADRRWWLLAVPAAALAAGLVLVFQPLHRAPQTRPAARYVQGGLYDGQAAQQLADPQLMRQQAIMQLPGGSDGGHANGL